MKHNWEYKRLGDICTVNFGKRIVAKDTTPGPYKVYGGGGATFTTLNFNRENCTIVSRFAMSSNCVRFVKGKFFLNDSGLTIETKIDFLTQGFIDKFLWVNQPLIYGLGRGMAQKNLNVKALLEINVPVPPMEVQERIVAELDKINETIEDCRELLRNLDALAQSLFYEYFGKFYIDNSPHYKSLKEVFDTVTDFVAAGSFASLRENVIYQDSPNYAQLVRTMDIKSNFTKGQFVFVDKHAFDFLWRVNLDKECIILPNIGVNCGEVYHLKPSNLIYDNNVLGPNAILVRSSKYNHLFLSFALKSDDFQKQLSKITSQVAQPKFNKTNLKELKVLIPPLALQEQFAARIEQIEAQKEAVESTIAELQTLLDSRMDYWFN